MNKRCPSGALFYVAEDCLHTLGYYALALSAHGALRIRKEKAGWLMPAGFPERVAVQYLTEQPYGVVFGVDTGLPAMASVSAMRTKLFAVLTSSGREERLSSIAPA